MAWLELAFDHAPNPWLLMARAAAPKPTHVANLHIPRMVATLQAAPVNHVLLARYRLLCGFPAGATLPVSFPHVLAAPLHLALLGHPSFPLRLMGAVHVRNHITQKRALHVSEPLAIQVVVDGHNPVDGGVEIDVATVLRVAGEVVWESVSTMLIRSGGKKESKAYTPPDFSLFQPVTTLDVPEDIGRRYGAVAKDFNPIHVHALTARLMGFPRALAHGMWTFARCVAALQASSHLEACALDVAFKRPLFLPARAFLVAQRGKDGMQFALHDGVVKTVFLTGNLSVPS